MGFVASTFATKLQEARRLLRLFMNDTAELNRLIKQQESTDEQMDLALRLTIDDWNITPPPLGNMSIETFPSIFLLIHGAAIQLLKMAGILQSRNELNYSSGGVTVRTFDKTRLYQSWIGIFVQEYERKKTTFKIAQNIAAAMGQDGVHSEYNTLAWYW
jgi:hypothetical protein